MYDTNYLVNNLVAASAADDSKVFANLPDGTQISYGDFFAGAERFAKTLLSKGVQPNDRVAVQVDKSIEVLQLYIGTVLAGAVFLPLNTAYTAPEIRYFLEDATPSVFVCSSTKLEELRAVVTAAGAPVLETLNADGTGSLINFDDLDTSRFVGVERAENDLAAILYTSGTTGRSKGAMLSHQNLWSNANTLKEYWHFKKSDCLIHALPIFHTHGLFVAINVTLAAGSSIILMPSFNADKLMQVMPNATVLMGVPTFYVRLLGHSKLSENTTKSMRLFVSGSAPLLAETHASWWATTGHAILERYGMTETNMNTSNPYSGDRRPGTVGLPLPGVEVRITDPQTQEPLPINSVGSIEVRGPNVFHGYWKMPEKTREELRENGFFITGDLGLFDDQGYVSIIGRSKDLIITGGYNVYPKEIELLIDDLEGVSESAIIGVEHADFGEAVTAVIVRQAGSEIDEKFIKDSLLQNLAKYKQPKRVFFVEELPRNTMGKVQKNILRDTFTDSYNSFSA